MEDQEDGPFFMHRGREVKLMAKTFEAEPWERQPGESAKAFEAFVIYRDMGVDRSARRVAIQLSKSNTLIHRWSKDNKWIERVAAWDSEQDRIRREEQRKEIAKMRARHTKLAQSMLLKAAEALKRLDPDEMQSNNITRMIDVATQLERLSRGDTTDSIEIRDGGKSEPAVTFYMPDNGRDDDNADNI